MELSKILMYELNYDYIKNEYRHNSIKTEDIFEDFSKDKEIFDLRNYSTKSKYYDNSNKLVVGIMKDDTAGVAIEEFVRLKPKMYLHLVNDNSEQNV